MSAPTPKDPQFDARIRMSFAKQGLMKTIGAQLTRISPGAVEIALPALPGVSQQHGFVHGGAIAYIADSAAGYAAMTLMPPGIAILTAEFKINFLAPSHRGSDARAWPRYKGRTHTYLSTGGGIC